ncbi:TFIIB-type zinc finger domain-containing protein [uncultured Lentibacter sp.]|uniref:TFIIB-type zinc finger domain-containing protein n=1 Tax=uncultured Lentibacter sp. TaxID=1659309 RepID=UPI00262DEF27|nr:TFIIB-type zinc finger domain-containing protein [uncultured Lentibacter sp.]
MSHPALPGVTTAHRFPCTACGADRRFDAGHDRLICDHCGQTQTIAQPPPPGALSGGPSVLRELDFEAALAASLPAQAFEDLRVSHCPNCAAEVAFDAHIHAAECPFCATPVVTDTGPQRHIKPQGVLPFALDENTARRAMTDWLGRLWFAPNGLQDYARKGRSLSGIYLPYWTFDADTRTRYSGARGTVYFETRKVLRKGRAAHQQIAKLRWSPVSGRVARYFDDVLVRASRALPAPHSEGLKPWDLAALKPYRPDYLAGFRAEGYTVPLPDAYQAARARMAEVIEQDIKHDIGGDRQRIHDIDTAISDVTFKHILLPVWLAAYKYRGQSYRCVVNGQTGRVQGERPYSPWKIAFALLLGLIIAGISGYLYGLEQGAF